MGIFCLVCHFSEINTFHLDIYPTSRIIYSIWNIFFWLSSMKKADLIGEFLNVIQVLPQPKCQLLFLFIHHISTGKGTKANTLLIVL